MSDDFETELKINIYEDKNLNNVNTTIEDNEINDDKKIYDKYLENNGYKNKQPSLEVENIQVEGTFLLPRGNEILKSNSDDKLDEYSNMPQAFQEPSDFFNHIEDIDNKKSFRPPNEKRDIFGKDFFNFNFESDNQKILKKLTAELVDTYKLCNDEYQYTVEANPRRVLTQPSVPTYNNGNDNENNDFILYINDIIGEKNRQYLILDLFGKGTFGQVVKCKNLQTGEFVALKVIKNKPAYLNQSKIEISILDMLNNYYDKDNEHHIVRVTDSFMFKNHLCIVFEELNKNLYEVLKQQNYYGLSTKLNCIYISQILDCLSLLRKARVIHCDLKPENILIDNKNSQFIKVIDFGSACYGNHLGGSYIQSRFYRSIEVLLGYPYTNAIDMWSLGCITAELFIGLPLFPGTSEYEQVQLIVNLFGVPPTYLIEKSKSGKKFFERVGIQKGQPIYKFKEKYSKKMEKESNYTNKGKTIEEVMQLGLSQRRNIPKEDMERDISRLPALIDFLRGLLNLDPQKRWTPDQAMKHPFLTGEEFTGPYIPAEKEPVLPNPNKNNLSLSPNSLSSSSNNTHRHHHHRETSSNASSNNSNTESRVSRIEKKLKSRSLKSIPKIKDLHPKIQKFISKYSNSSENKMNTLKSKESIEKEKNGIFRIKKIDKNNKLVLVSNKKVSKESITNNHFEGSDSSDEEDFINNDSEGEEEEKEEEEEVEEELDMDEKEEIQEPTNLLQVDFSKVTLDDRNSVHNIAMNQIPPPVPEKDNIQYKPMRKSFSNEYQKQYKNNSFRPALPLKDNIKTDLPLLPKNNAISSHHQSISKSSETASKDEKTSRTNINLDNFAHIKELDSHQLSRLSISMESFNLDNQKYNESTESVITDSKDHLSVDPSHSLNRRRKSDNELRLSSYGGLNFDGHHEKNGYYFNDVNKVTLTRQYSLLSNTSSLHSFPSLPRIPNGSLGLDIDMNAEFDNYSSQRPTTTESNLQVMDEPKNYHPSDNIGVDSHETKILIDSNNDTTDTNNLLIQKKQNGIELGEPQGHPSNAVSYYNDNKIFNTKIYNEEIYHGKVCEEEEEKEERYPTNDQDHNVYPNKTSEYFNYTDPTLQNFFGTNYDEEGNDKTNDMLVNNISMYPGINFNEVNDDLIEMEEGRSRHYSLEKKKQLNSSNNSNSKYDRHNLPLYSEEGHYDKPEIQQRVLSNFNDNDSFYHEKIYTSSMDNYPMQTNRTNSIYDNTNHTTFDHNSISYNDYSDYYNKNSSDSENIILTIDQQQQQQQAEEEEEPINDHQKRRSSFNPSLDDPYHYTELSRNRSNTINTANTILTTTSDSNYNLDVPLPQNGSDDSFSKLINSEPQEFMNDDSQDQQKNLSNYHEGTILTQATLDQTKSNDGQYYDPTDQKVSLHEDIKNSEISQPISPIIISQPTTSLISLNAYRLPLNAPVVRSRSSSIVRHKYNNLISSHDNVYDNNLANNVFTFDYPTTVNNSSFNSQLHYSNSNNSMFYSQAEGSHEALYNESFSRDTGGDHSTIKEKKSIVNSGSGVMNHEDPAGDTSHFYSDIYESMYINNKDVYTTTKDQTDFKIDIETQDSRKVLGTHPSNSTPVTPSRPPLSTANTTTSTPYEENNKKYDTILPSTKSHESFTLSKGSNSYYSMSKKTSYDNMHHSSSNNLDYSYDMDYKLDFSNTVLDPELSGIKESKSSSRLPVYPLEGERGDIIMGHKSYPSSIHDVSIYNNNTTINVDLGKIGDTSDTNTNNEVLNSDLNEHRIRQNPSVFFSQPVSATADHGMGISIANKDSHIEIDMNNESFERYKLSSPTIPSSYPNETLHYNNIDVDVTPTNHLSLKRNNTSNTNTSSSAYGYNKRSSSSVFLPTYNILSTPILPYQLDSASIFSSSEISSNPSPPMNSTTINIDDNNNGTNGGSTNPPSLPRSYSTGNATLMNSTSQPLPPPPPDTINRRVSLTCSSISSNSINFYPSNPSNNNIMPTTTPSNPPSKTTTNYTKTNPVNTNKDLFEKPRERSKSYQYNPTYHSKEDQNYSYPLPPLPIHHSSADSIHSLSSTTHPPPVHPSSSSSSSNNIEVSYPTSSIPSLDRNSSFRQSHPMINYNNTFFGLPPEQRFVSSSNSAGLPPPPPPSSSSVLRPMTSSQDLHSSANTSSSSIHHYQDNSVLPTHYTSFGNSNTNFIQQAPPPLTSSQGTTDTNYSQNYYIPTLPPPQVQQDLDNTNDDNTDLDLNIQIGQ